MRAWCVAGGLALLAGCLVFPAPGRAAHAEPIWPRIAAGMRMVDGEHPETVIWARHYAQRPHQFQQMLARAEPFLWYIVEAVELRELPLELALVPAVESNFDPRAHSPQKASGLWQFVPRTGRALGLRETRHYDARRDAVESTRAALQYLQKLHRRFDQDWLLALAAYNVGERALARAIERAGSRNFWDLTELPAETREHVPRLLGIALLIQQPQRFGISLPAIANRHAADMVVLDQPRDLGRAAQRASIEPDTIERYNPGLKSLANTQGKRWLLLPPDEAARLRAELAQREYRPRREPVQEHVVADGESLWRIARRYRVSIAELREWNGLRKTGVLRPGRKLLIRQAG